MGKDPIFSFRIPKRHWIRDNSEGPEKMALESVLFIKILVIKKLYLHQIESQAQHADSCIAWSCRPSNEFTARPNEHLVEEVDWKRNDTKKNISISQSKKELYIYLWTNCWSKENILQYNSDWEIFVKLLRWFCLTEQDSAPISAFTELTVLSSSARCKRSNTVPI